LMDLGYPGPGLMVGGQADRAAAYANQRRYPDQLATKLYFPYQSSVPVIGNILWPAISLTSRT
jgi:hypothetical protein